MCTEDNPDFCADVPDEPTTTDAIAAETTPVSGLRRRTFLKAAALGGAAAVLSNRRFSALAHTDTKSSCTAQDIEVTGGQIINEPCEGGAEFFDAIAAFTVSNHNNAARNCITLHLGFGGTLGEQDFLLFDNDGSSSISGNGTSKTMYAHLGTISGEFGVECYPGSVVAFRTAKNQSDTTCDGPTVKYPGGQCRRQDICITGFDADLECVGGSCAVPCGGTLSLQASAEGGTQGSNGTYTFVLTDPNGVEAGRIGPASSPQTFAVSGAIEGTYTLTAIDSNGCWRTASVPVTTTEINAFLSAVAGGCEGSVTFTASTDGGAACNYQWLVGEDEVQNGASDTFTYDPVQLGTLDGGTRVVTVHASCGGCEAGASASISSCATSTVF
jgi:hypothetical protein